MALGGGAWITQNKILPGTYVNVTSRARATAALSNRGTAAAPFVLSWGPEGEVFAVTAQDFQTDCKRIFGYAREHPRLLPLREIFTHATTVYCYRLGTGAVKAGNAYADAKYPGVRGNDLTITIEPNVDDADKWDVSTWLEGVKQDTQTAASAAELTDNDWVVFKPGAGLEATAGAPLTGGADAGSITGDSHQAFLNQVEPYAFNVLCCPASDAAAVKLYTAFTKRMRDETGAKFQLVAWQPEGADYEGVIGVWNRSAHTHIPDVEPQSIVYWTAGAEAGTAVNQTLTNAVYDGELTPDTAYTQTELEAAVKSGRFLFHRVNGETRVLEDVNTLQTLTDTKGAVFQSNQTLRVCDQIANDLAVLFNTRYAGTVPNDASGRAALWGDVVQLIVGLEQIRAVENFDPSSVTCGPGSTKKAVLCTISGLNVINAMSQLYLSVVIS